MLPKEPISNTSLVTVEDVMDQLLWFGHIEFKNNDAYWLETRPHNNGQSSIVHYHNGDIVDVTPPNIDVHSCVYEYGGGDFCVGNDAIYFIRNEEQDLCYVNQSGNISVILSRQNSRFGDLVFSETCHILCVREQHYNSHVIHDLIAISVTMPDQIVSIASGHDFYSSVQIDTKKHHICWLTWDHPQMPWDGTELWIGTFDSSFQITEVQKIAGGKSISIYQPQWSDDGDLFYVSDESGWWNINVYDMSTKENKPIYQVEIEFGRAQWELGTSTYAFIDTNNIIALGRKNGKWNLIIINLQDKTLRFLKHPFTEIADICCWEDTAFFKAGASDIPESLIMYDIDREEYITVRSSSNIMLHKDMIVYPKWISYQSEDNVTVYAYLYLPHLTQDFNNKPPLIVISHGGPTSNASTLYNPSIQFWTSRGIAILDVDYRGSTGYGRAYREMLKGRWGKADVRDCVEGALYLKEMNVVDGLKIGISGASASGLTSLMALTDSRNIFKLAAVQYAVCDLELFSKETHKFEAFYLEQLVGHLPDEKEKYRAVSPLFQVGKISVPVIFFQGLRDPVVPPDQSQIMIETLQRRGIESYLITFDNEAHGIIHAENIRKVLTLKWWFYKKIFDSKDLADF